LLAQAPVNLTSYRDDWHRYLLTGTESGWRRILTGLRRFARCFARVQKAPRNFSRGR
jgi:hypothetical protein